MLDVNELRQGRAALIEKLRKKHDESINRGSHTAAEDTELAGLQTEIEALENVIAREEGLQSREANLAQVAFRNGEAGELRSFSHGGNGNGEYATADKNDLISRDQSFEKHLRSRGLLQSRPEIENLSLGGIMRSLVTGPRTREERASLAEGADATGGVSVPDITLARFIDKLRARTVCIRAGAQTLPLTSDKTTIARTTTDPVCAWRAEAGPIAESDPAFEGLVFTARSLAVYFKASREVLEDSVNIEAALEASLLGALSVELDRVALEGTGTPPEPKGIVPTTGVGAVAVGAAITTWDEFVNGLYELWIDNAGEPTGIMLHPRTLKTVSLFKEGGTNSPLARPPVLANIPIYPTTGMSITLAPGTATNVIIGDFTQLIFGIRTELRIEVLRELFAVNHQYGFVAHLRADIGLQHPQSFVKLTGIVP